MLFFFLIGFLLLFLGNHCNLKLKTHNIQVYFNYLKRFLLLLNFESEKNEWQNQSRHIFNGWTLETDFSIMPAFSAFKQNSKFWLRFSIFLFVSWVWFIFFNFCLCSLLNEFFFSCSKDFVSIISLHFVIPPPPSQQRSSSFVLFKNSLTLK